MSTEIREKIKVRKLFCIFKKYRKFQQLIFHNHKPGFRPSHASSIPLRSISLRAFAPAMPVRFRFAPSHCGLSPQPCQFDSASLHLTAGFRPIQEDTDRWSCASTTSGPYLPVHGSMLIVTSSGYRQIRPEVLHP